MNSRSILATSFVLTAAALPGCGGSTIGTERPPPPCKPPGPDCPGFLSQPQPRITITRDENALCWAQEDSYCDPGDVCNPPPPRQVDCPPEGVPND